MHQSLLTVTKKIKTTPPSRSWRFNTSLLQDPDFIAFFEKEWTIFSETNDLPNISPSILWETAKAVMRGKIISYSSYKKKKERALETELELKIKTLEAAHAASQDEQLLSELRKVKLKLN